MFIQNHCRYCCVQQRIITVNDLVLLGTKIGKKCIHIMSHYCSIQSTGRADTAVKHLTRTPDVAGANPGMSNLSYSGFPQILETYVSRFTIFSNRSRLLPSISYQYYLRQLHKISNDKDCCVALVLNDHINSWPGLCYVNIPGKNTALSEVSRKVSLDVNADKTTYTVVSHHQNAGQCHNLLIANTSPENVAQFKYLQIQ
jgi:hypothetical protein